LNTTDIIILGILLFGAFQGYKKGFLMELIAIFALILGIIGGFKLIHLGIDLLDEYITSEILPFLSFILIFVAIVILVNLLGKALKEIIHLTPLGSIDSLVGAVIGVFKWAFGLSVLIWIFGNFNVELPADAIEGSSIYPLVESIAPWTADQLSIIFPFLDQAFDSIKQQLNIQA
jgi:membrane protein required for colicin V production